MNIAISGATGFIGKHLTTFLTAEGHHIIPLGRTMFRENMSGELVQALSQCDVVINLAGATIMHRWTANYKRKMYDSRILLTQKLVQALHATVRKPSLFISASAVGYYPPNGVFDEYSGIYGEDFLAELCHAWEKEAMKRPAQTRLVITRFAPVLAPDGGALKQMLMPLKVRTAVSMGPGTQPFLWVDMQDLCRAFSFIIGHKEIAGAVNMVALQAVTQREFALALARKYKAWFRITIPVCILRLFLGEASSFLTTGQCVHPTRLLEFGFTFQSPTVETFFDNIKTNK